LNKSSNNSQKKFITNQPLLANSRTPKKYPNEPSQYSGDRGGSQHSNRDGGRKKLGGVNGGAGGDFYIGLDEAYQGDIELYFRGHFTGLIERFIEAVLSDQNEKTRDQTYTLDEYKINILSVVNRKCQNLLTALFAGNRANFIRL